MKKVLGFLMAATAVVLLSVSCRKVERAQCVGVIDELTDSFMITRVDGSKVKFDITEAKYTNGAVMYGDSVMIDYIGNLSMNRAFAEVVRLIPRLSPTIPMEVDSTKELQTRPAESERVQQTLKGIEEAKKHLKK